MADRAKKISELATLTTPSSDDLLVIVDDPSGNAVTKKVTVGHFLTNCSSNVTVSNSSVLSANTFQVRNFGTPANSGITIQQGVIFYDNAYLYIAVANNTLKRVSLSSF